jgi:oxygen-dependent protoporphyrinogen oxidase
MTDKKDSSAKVLVIGAGITGLACAYEIVKGARKIGRRVEVSLLEASPRIGGKIATDRSNGVLTEGGPDSFLAAKPEAVGLCKELGLEKDLIPANPKSSRVWVYSRNKLYSLPKGTGLVPSKIFPFLFSNLLTLKGRLRVLVEPWIPIDSGVGDESIASFVSRRLGQEFLDKIADPIISGIYAAPSEKISLLSAFPSLREMEKKGGIFRALANNKPPQATFMTLREGISSLSNALARELPANAIKRENPVLSIKAERGMWRARTLKENFMFDAVVSAVPANAFSPLLLDLSQELSSVLSEISFASSAVVNLIYDRAVIPHPLNGYGFVSCRINASLLMAATFSSVKFPHRSGPGKALIRVFLGGLGKEDMETDIAAKDENALAAIAHKAISGLLGIKSAPLETRALKWIKAHPVYSVGHGLRMKRIESCLKDHPGLFVAGSSYHGIGLSDCIRSGSRAAQQVLNFMFQNRQSH